MNLKMTVLIDNVASEPLAGEWGLSILITLGEKKILLDTGAGHLFAQNAELLGIDLADIDTGVLSHAHYDHSDGMDTFFAKNREASFLLREGTCEDCFGIKEGALNYIGIHQGFLQEYKERIRYVSGVHEIFDGVWLVPHRKADYASIALRNELFLIRDGKRCPDSFGHEQSLVIDTPKGLVVFNSCSHTGMKNILADIREMLGRSDVCAYVGGLHLYKMTDEELQVLCDEIKQTQIGHIFTGHCTGDHAFDFLKAELGGRIEQFSSGFTYEFI
ncbi:MAG: MBL fold metallo-hydrolase [Lachnospiraceae bacterium]|nr:MBL fold metallo-hydrolase [Lachnospiraceae bacterium]